jgi:tetratricopeptide (TPR) repeat protein
MHEGGTMRTYRWFTLYVAIGITLIGCSTLSEDKRLSNLAFDEISQGNYQQAEKHLEEALSLNPLSPYALLNMGVVYQNTGRLSQARLMYIRVIAQNPDATAVRSNRNESTGKSLATIAKENLQNLR